MALHNLRYKIIAFEYIYVIKCLKYLIIIVRGLIVTASVREFESVHIHVISAHVAAISTAITCEYR